MPRFLLPFSFLMLGLLAACGSDELFSIPQNASELRHSSRYQTIEIAEVQLPDYAASDEIWIESETGALNALGPLWADDPVRSITQQLAQNIGAITGARVAADPWPFRDYAQVKVEVRVTRMHGADAGIFLLSGQYFIAPEEGGRNRSRNFDISIPIAASGSASAIASARAIAVTQLAEDISRNAL